ncbi:MAG: hydantoinase B/oxoprolinase family protein [Thiotrichales bacterium]
MSTISSIDLSLFARRIESICDEMGALLRRSAFSPNIRDRLDYSCAVFDPEGKLAAQAAHIPVHLGSMAHAMESIVTKFEWEPGDQVIWNDPFIGGTHLPDITIVAPVFHSETSTLVGFVASRAHYADIGASAPGSMPLTHSLEEEGLIISPRKIQQAGSLMDADVGEIVNQVRNPDDTRGDLNAQLGCNAKGVKRVEALVARSGLNHYFALLKALNDYAEVLARSALKQIPAGVYRFTDVMDDDGYGSTLLPIQVELTIVEGGEVRLDFSGTALQVHGNINCPMSVTAAAVWYVFRCLMPENTPACAGCFRPIRMTAVSGSLVNASYPAAVAAGNVETSSRIVDAVLGALAQALPQRIPAASQGTMNNIAFGGYVPDIGHWGYYETLGGGMGGSAIARGLSAVQSHMTNTRNTPVEVFEQRFPMRISRYEIRKHSGGIGKHPGGDGIVREYLFEQNAQCTFLTERRSTVPWGIEDGQPGTAGKNLYNQKPVKSKLNIDMKAGDTITVMTPGGGAWGAPE